MEDPGATIQPYFRSIVGVPNLTSAALQRVVADTFGWTPITLPTSPEQLARQLAAVGPVAWAFYFAKENVCVILSPRNPDLLMKYEAERKPAWRRLPYAILHRYLIDEVIAPKFLGGETPTIHYHKTMQEAIDEAGAGGGIGILMPATTMTQLRDICTAGELMPQKSTYFYPKLATGMVINPLY